ncbi:MAG: methylated-DNA--[protein]-cysteine S-methyltransferase [Bdellovibrionales bacterium]
MSDLSFSNIPPDAVLWSVSECSAGPILIGLTAQSELCRVAFLDKKKPASLLREWKGQWPQTLFKENTKPPRKIDALPVLLVGTDFQHRVWAALLDIPAGETVTYGELAARIGKPKAARSVGTALGANPVPVIVPCHRVIGANGLGGFSSGIGIKKRLLEAES